MNPRTMVFDLLAAGGGLTRTTVSQLQSSLSAFPKRVRAGRASITPVRVLVILVALSVLPLVFAAPGRGQWDTKPRVALLCVWKPPDLPLMENALYETVIAARNRSGRTKDELPVLIYSWSMKKEREYCEKSLKIREEDIPCLAVARFKRFQGAPSPVGTTIYRATPKRDDLYPDERHSECALETKASEMVGRAIEEQRRYQNHVDVGLLLVLSRPLSPGAGTLRRLQSERKLLDTLADKTVRLVAEQTGFDESVLRGAVLIRPSDESRHPSLGEAPVAAVAVVDDRNEIQGIEYQQRLVEGRIDETAANLCQEWADHLPRRPPVPGHDEVRLSNTGWYPYGGLIIEDRPPAEARMMLILNGASGGAMGLSKPGLVLDRDFTVLVVKVSSLGASSFHDRDKMFKVSLGTKDTPLRCDQVLKTCDADPEFTKKGVGEFSYTIPVEFRSSTQKICLTFWNAELKDFELQISLKAPAPRGR